MGEPTGTGAIGATEIPLVPTVITSKWMCTKEGAVIEISEAMPGSRVKISLELRDCEEIGEITITIFDNTADDKAELTTVKAQVNRRTAITEEIEIAKEWAGKTIKIKVKENPFEKEYVGAELEIGEIKPKCTVLFRPHNGYKGEFGFDWLRDGKPNNTDLDYEAYDEAIVAGYNDGVTNLSKADAYSKLKDEYPQIDTNEHLEEMAKYCVPYLNLFPKAYSEAVDAGINPKPPFEAKLKLWVRIEYNDVDEIRLEFDEAFFAINNCNEPFVLSKKNMNTDFEDADEITITCLNELTEDKTITAYAYPKGSLAKPKEEQEKERIVAGQLLLCKNDTTVRKEANFVFVHVITDVTGSGEQTGEIRPKEQELLRGFLYQALIYPLVWVKREDTDGNLKFITLDLRKDRRFLTKEAARTLAENDARNAGVGDTAITAAGDAAENDPDAAKHLDDSGKIDFNISTMHSSRTKYKIQDMMQDLEQKFMNDPDNTEYKNNKCFPIFAFKEQSTSFGGLTEATGRKNVILASNRYDSTIPHEVYHGFGLSHTHNDNPPPGIIRRNKQNQKYIFPTAPAAGSTANIMSYNSDKCKSTWKWQWEIARQNV